MKTNWKIKNNNEVAVQQLMDSIGVSRVMASILSARGYNSAKSAELFINPMNNQEYDPFLLTDMSKAVDRINKAFANNETIGIIGDYDVDGITATAVLFKYFKSKNIHVEYHIPARDGEGYGINNATIENFKNIGCSLIISVDCGITAISEVEYAKSIGIDVIITDHHKCGEEIPDAIAVVNPKRNNDNYPFPHLSGVGVAYKLVQALGNSINTDEYTAFTALGTLSDMMPVVDENRKIISSGLKNISNGINIGISKLVEKSGVQLSSFNSYSVSFIVAPRMNAAGRMETAETALKLLLEEDENKASDIAEKLCALNKERQDTEADIYNQAVTMVDNDPSYKDDKILVLFDENWHQGVIGIVAAKLTEKYHKPSILFTSANNTGKGSGRSINGFSIHKAVSDCQNLLTKLGGHEYAVGLGIDIQNIPLFRAKINENNSDVIFEDKTIIIDSEIYPHELSLGIAREVHSIEPFGEGNPQPIFVMKNVLFEEVRLVKDKHTKIGLKYNNLFFDAIFYNKKPDEIDANLHDKIDVVFTVGINEYNGMENLQIVIKDISLSNTLSDACNEFSQVVRTGLCSSIDYPEYYDFEYIYKAFARYAKNTDYKPFIERADILADKLNNTSTVVFTPVKLMLVLAIFSELSFMDVKIENGSIFVNVKKEPQNKKLDESRLYRSLKKDV